MSVLGKDLFDFQRSHTNTKVEFGASGYWVEMVPEMQPYGTVLTEILNLDVTPFQKLLDRLNTAVHEKNYDDAPRAYMDMQKGFGSLPLYRFKRDGWTDGEGMLTVWVYENTSFELAKDVESQTFPWTEEGVEAVKAWLEQKLKERGTQPYFIPYPVQKAEQN